MDCGTTNPNALRIEPVFLAVLSSRQCAPPERARHVGLALIRDAVDPERPDHGAVRRTYLLSDKVLAGRTPVLHYRLVEGRDLYLYSVAGANTAGYAVTQVRRAASGREAIAILAKPSFDPRTTAILTTQEEMPPLVPVSASSVTIERGGYRIEADGPGTSLLVLPIEYSHCLHANLIASDMTAPRLLRVNLAMAGILFSGRVEGRLSLRYGPLSSECRMQDWRDAIALHLGEAREWPSGP
jgi:hypothetical protein